MVKKIINGICNIRQINTIVISAIVVAALGTSWAYFVGLGNRVEASESAQAAMCKEVEKNKADIIENKKSVDNDISGINETLTTMQSTMTQVQVDVGKLQSDSESSKELLNKIWNKLDRMED